MAYRVRSEANVLGHRAIVGSGGHVGLKDLGEHLLDEGIDVIAGQRIINALSKRERQIAQIHG
jgi:hypothetical protein